MTRYTNVGRKRAYIESGFSNDEATAAVENEDSNNQNIQDDARQTENPSSPPPAKKRKRLQQKQKHAKNEFEKVAVDEKDQKDSLGSELSGDVEASQEAKEVRKAYTNREGNRQKEAERSEWSQSRRLKRQREKLANTTCFACREKGHAVKDCPKAVQSDKSAARSSKTICYRCGSTKHTLSRCKKPENPDNPLPYASCYVCSGKGHLASSCPQNKDKGVYPNGGCCKLCGETSHLAKNCPMRKQVQESPALLVGTGWNAGADEDDFHILKRVNADIDSEEQKEKRKKAKTKTKANENEDDGATAMNMAAKPTIPPQAVKKKVVVF